MPEAYHPNIHLDVEGHVATVTLDRPEAKNACTGDMWVALGRTFQDLGASGARAAVLTGAGGDFCAGADLVGGGDAQIFPAKGSTIDYMRVLADSVLAIHRCPIPVVSKVEGYCVGAGLGLALAADLTWCAEDATFSAIFAKRGLSLDFGTSWLLRQRIGVHKAKELAFTAAMVSGSEAVEIGLVNRAVPAEELGASVQELVATIAGGPPLALATTKRELDHAGTSSFAEALEAEALGQTLAAQSEDLQEALIAHAERRPPVFKGR